jgi:hypothetical protein
MLGALLFKRSPDQQRFRRQMTAIVASSVFMKFIAFSTTVLITEFILKTAPQ